VEQLLCVMPSKQAARSAEMVMYDAAGGAEPRTGLPVSGFCDKQSRAQSAAAGSVSVKQFNIS